MGKTKTDLETLKSLVKTNGERDIRERHGSHGEGWGPFDIIENLYIVSLHMQNYNDANIVCPQVTSVST